MLNKITTYLIVGSLGTGKTSLIQQLLKQKPSNEQWAVLINEFGRVGVDKALLGEQAVTISEIAGGCICCTGGAPFQVGLNRLLKESKPDVLFIELSGLGHPLQVQKQLQAEPWNKVLTLYPLLQVVEAKQLLADFQPYNSAGLLLVNKSEQLTKQQQQAINKQFAPFNLYWTTQGYLPLSYLPKQPLVEQLSQQQIYIVDGEDEQKRQLAEGIVCHIQDQLEGWSIGWQFEPCYCFDKIKLDNWLKQYQWLRAKLVVHTNQGWLSVNAVAEDIPAWQATEWRKDSRLELIFATKQAEQMLIDTLLSTIS
ncbi:CobW-like GTP-binding protein [Entomomonas sp. E2T0]|uniref:CobW family GTP-binding protein n=1 Tax=Entomomonas sp. E2T0 TaxID=2930213 RepID=UPI0022284C56|nr:CobW-like GTP-binding protein [Entomomonas sp. E2T0]UYZ83224.1 CobW-like GTP-binding protein [Entomomonas sp. E2T0]